jgi:hypothetical protein
MLCGRMKSQWSFGELVRRCCEVQRWELREVVDDAAAQRVEMLRPIALAGTSVARLMESNRSMPYSGRPASNCTPSVHRASRIKGLLGPANDVNSF